MQSVESIVRVIKLRRMRWTEHVARMGEFRNVHMMLMGKPEGKRSLEKSRCSWEDIDRMYLGEVELEVIDWIYMAEDMD
jgi:hypothetical protein